MWRGIPLALIVLVAASILLLAVGATGQATGRRYNRALPKPKVLHVKFKDEVSILGRRQAQAFSAPAMNGRITSVKNNFDLCEQQGFPDFSRLTVEVARQEDVEVVMSELRNDPAVASVEREEAWFTPEDIIPNDPGFAAKWDHKQLRAPEVWEILKDLPEREEKVVCVIDTG